MMTSSNGNMFHVTGFCAGEFTGDCGEFTGHWSFDAFFDLRRNKRLRKQSRRRWFETPARSLLRHCNVVPNSDPVIRTAVGSSGVQRVTWGGYGHYGRNGLKFGTLLYPDYHSLKLTKFCTQRQFKLVVSHHPSLSGSLSLWCQIIHELLLSWGWGGGGGGGIYVLYNNEWPACSA